MLITFRSLSVDSVSSLLDPFSGKLSQWSLERREIWGLKIKVRPVRIYPRLHIVFPPHSVQLLLGLLIVQNDMFSLCPVTFLRQK